MEKIYNLSTRSMYRFNTLENEFKSIHKNNYTYDYAIYENMTKKILITCRIHGNFEQTPAIHIKGYGCPKCPRKNAVSNNDFAIKANKKHKNKYSYEKVNYINNTEKVIITCPIHGDFEQRPANHLLGKGCRLCKCDSITKYSDSGLIISISCSKCKQEKKENDFVKKTKICKDCNSKRSKEYYEKNKEIINEKNSIYQKKNKEKIKIYNKAKYEKNKDIEKVRHKKYREENKNKILKKNREYYKTENGIFSKINDSNKRRSYKKSTSDGTATTFYIKNLLKKQNNMCNNCDKIINVGENANLDHHIPLSKGGTHSQNNLVWLCNECNFSKGSKIPVNNLSIKLRI